MIKTNFSTELCSIDYSSYESRLKEFEKWYNNEKSSDSGMLGWSDWASNVTEAEIEKILNIADKIRKNYEVLVVVGVGGSYLGARSVIEGINGLFQKAGCEIIYLGNTMSARYVSQVLDYLKEKNFAVAVISKSGKTLETSLAYRLLKALLIEKMGDKFADAIVAVTDETSGALRDEVKKIGCESFVIPKNIGGRYSVITPVGLLPIAVAGIDIKKFLDGVRQAEKDLASFNVEKNSCYQYAVIRHELESLGKTVELFVTYDPQLRSFCEWIKQLFGESEGKDKKGILPVSAIFTTDLHSFGQFIQDGTPCLFETVLNIQSCDSDIALQDDKDDFCGLNSLSGKSMNYINDIMVESVIKAHTTGGVPNIILNMDALDEYNLGYLIYFFMKACTFSCFLTGVNPFNQPGVEIYKANANALLKK